MEYLTGNIIIQIAIFATVFVADNYFLCKTAVIVQDLKAENLKQLMKKYIYPLIIYIVMICITTGYLFYMVIEQFNTMKDV